MNENTDPKKLKDVLTEKADGILQRIRSAETLHDIARDVGVYPAQIDKFLRTLEAYREPYREALQTAAALNAKTLAKVKKARGHRTHLEIVGIFEQEILDRLVEGELVREVAEGYQVGYAAVGRYFRSSEELTARYQAAMMEGGHALAEKSVQAAQSVVFDATEARMADLKSRRLAWLAAKRNPQYDQRQQLEVKGHLTHSVTLDIQA
ncbi:MAG: hypothetical protein V4772_03280 [Pseudomonadota bacterium]